MEPKEICLGISPCPNDTFIFYHLLNRQDLPFRLKLIMADVEQLNRMVLEGTLDVSKVSFGLAARVLDRYLVLESGSALGRGCGPLILGNSRMNRQQLENAVIAIPGTHTTAALLLRLYLPRVRELRPMLFSRVPGAILDGEVDAGCVIHETRFTYKDMGLVCVEDLGAWWETKTGKPLPLGGIIARRTISYEVTRMIDRGIRRSIEFAMRHPEETSDFVRQHAQEISSRVQERHIDLYVNDFSLSLGREGKDAVRTLFDFAAGQGICRSVPGRAEPVFLMEKPQRER